MSDGLKVIVTPKNFSMRSTDEKLELIYQAVTSQQSICIKTVEKFKENCDKYDDHIEKSHNLPSRNRKIDLGIGAGVGTGSGFAVSNIIDYIRSYLSGG